MTTATKHLTATTKAPTAEGTFEGEILANPPEGDSDNERIETFLNVPGEFPLVYAHTYSDPGALIGTASVMSKGDGLHLIVLGRLDMEQSMARAVHERMLLPSRDPMALKELSVGFNYERSQTFKDDAGVTVIVDAELLEISVVHRGAQVTTVANVKGQRGCACTSLQLCRQHAAKLDGSRRYTKRKGRCGICGMSQTFDVRPPVPGGTVPWAQCACGALVGWSGKMDTSSHVAEMRKIRAFVEGVRLGEHPSVDPDLAGYKAELERILADWSPESRKYERVQGHAEVLAIQAEVARLDGTRKIRSDIGDRALEEKVRSLYSNRTDRDLLAELDELDPAGAKHTMRQADGAARATADGAAVCEAVRERVTPSFPSQTNRLFDIATSLRGISAQLAADGTDFESAAVSAVQRAQAMKDVALTLTIHGLDVDDLARAADRIISVCEELVGRQLAPPAAVEMVGGKMTTIPASMFLVEESPTAQPVDEESFSLEIGQVASHSFTIDTRPAEAPIPADPGETYRLDGAGTVESQHSTVEDEGQTWRIETA